MFPEDCFDAQTYNATNQEWTYENYATYNANKELDLVSRHKTRRFRAMRKGRKDNLDAFINDLVRLS